MEYLIIVTLGTIFVLGVSTVFFVGYFVAERVKTEVSFWKEGRE